jgi:hypothetical protein
MGDKSHNKTAGQVPLSTNEQLTVQSVKVNEQLQAPPVVIGQSTLTIMVINLYWRRISYCSFGAN